MEQKILIGIYIGASSASTAVMLSDKQDQMPEMISWDRGGKRMVPLRVGEKVVDSSDFRWGCQVEPADSATLFGLLSFYNCGGSQLPEKLSRDLYAKRGENYYHLPSSIYASHPLSSRDQFRLFLDSMKDHIMKKLADKYSTESLTMQMEICIALPPYLEDSALNVFKGMLVTVFEGAASKTEFIPQVLASLQSLNSDKLVAMKANELLLACHIEEEITTITSFVIRSGQPDFKLKYIACSVLAVGAHDIADAFQNRFQFAVAVAKKNLAAAKRDSASKVSNDLFQVRSKFLDGLHERIANGDETFREGQLRVTIDENEMQEGIFNPVLNLMAIHIDQLMATGTGLYTQRHILLSGILSECPYVDSFVRNRFAAQMIDTNDGSTSAAKGAAAFLASTKLKVIEGNQANKYMSNGVLELKHRLAWLREREATLNDLYIQQYQTEQPSWDSESEYICELRMIWDERLMREGMNNEDMLKTFKSIRRWLERLNRHQDAANLSQQLARWYDRFLMDNIVTSDSGGSMQLEITLSTLKGLHLAAAGDKHSELQTMLDAGFSCDTRPGPNPFSGTHTILDTCAWYGSQTRCAEILLDVFALPFNESTPRICARRGFFGLLELLQERFTVPIRKDCATLIRLAILGDHNHIVAWLQQIFPLYWTEWQPSEILDPLTGLVYKIAEIPVTQPRILDLPIVEGRNHNEDVQTVSRLEDEFDSIDPLPTLERKFWATELAYFAVFLADGRQLAVRGTDTIYIWDIATWELQPTLMFPKVERFSCARSTISVDGRLLAVQEVSAISIWEVATGSLQRTIEAKKKWELVGAIAFSYDGQQLACQLSDGKIQIWNVSTGLSERILAGDEKFIRILTFSPNGLLLASGSEKYVVRIWDVARGTVYRTIGSNYSGVLFGLAFSPDGQKLACGPQNNAISIWDIEGTLQQTLEGPIRNTDIMSVAFSPDGRHLAASTDNIVMVWHVGTGRLQQTLGGHSQNIMSVAFSPSGEKLVVCSWDGTVSIWGMAARPPQQILQNHVPPFELVNLSDDNSQLLSDFRAEVTQAQRETRKDTREGSFLAFSPRCEEIRNYDTPDLPIDTLAFSADGQLLASRCMDSPSESRIWNTATGYLEPNFPDLKEFGEFLAFSPDGLQLVSCFVPPPVGLNSSSTSRLQIWDIGSRKRQRTLLVFTGLQIAAFSPVGRWLAYTSAFDGKIQLWNTEIGGVREFRLIEREYKTRRVRSLVFSPNGDLLASVTECYVEIWAVATKSLQQTLYSNTPGAEIFSVAFSPDGKHMTCILDWRLEIWDSSTETLKKIYTHNFDEYMCGTAAFSPAARQLAIVTPRDVLIWDVTMKMVLQTLEGDSDFVESVAFSPDGQKLACATYSGTVRIWSRPKQPLTFN